jgi:hypothetical protein
MKQCTYRERNKNHAYLLNSSQLVIPSSFVALRRPSQVFLGPHGSYVFPNGLCDPYMIPT